MIDASTLTWARAVPIAHELHRRGIHLRRVGRELVGPCPVCGGTDRFAVHLVKQVWQCRRCPAGGGVIDLVMHLDSVSFADAVATLVGRPLECLHAQPLPPSARKPAPAPAVDARLLALRLWDEAAPIVGTLAEGYLRETRRLTLPPHVAPRVLRFHPRCPFGEGARQPCLLALYRDVVTDQPRAIMRTALTPDGRKIDRKALGNIAGAAIKLSDDADVSTGLTIGEGLETVLAGLMQGFAPAWALGSVGGIAKFLVLAGIEALTILAETNDGGASERAVTECAGRWLAAGREVYRATSLIGGDMNDALMVA